MTAPREALRRLAHILTLVIPLWIWTVPTPYMEGGLIAGSVAMLAIEWARHRTSWGRRWFLRIFGGLMRPYEHRRYLGATALGLSATLVALFFPREIAALAVLFVSLGDVLGGTVRLLVNARRRWVGSLTCLGVCLAVAWVYPFLPLQVKLAGALAAGAGEWTLYRFVDDNLSIPLLSAAVMRLLS